MNKRKDEINPEMAENVRIILLKRRKEKNKKSINNNSIRKDSKGDAIKKYFDDKLILTNFLFELLFIYLNILQITSPYHFQN